MKNNKTKHGLIWSAIERIGTQGVQLIIMLYLGRILGPVAFGYIGMLAFFISLAQVFIDSGFSAALIRKNDRTEKDLSTVFIFNITLSVVLYLTLFLTSKYIAGFYGLPKLESLLDVLAISIIINSLTIIPRVLLTVEVDFKTQAKVSLLSVIISGALAVIVARMGFGVWALITQTLIYSLMNCILINYAKFWYPKYSFNIMSFRSLFSFSSKLLVSGILDSIANNIYQLVIGKSFTPQLVGQYTQANQLSSVPAMTLTNIIQRVTYPVFCNMMHDKKSMDAAFIDTIKISSAVVFPILVGIGIIAKPFLLFLLGDEWRSASEMLLFLCFGYMLYPVHAINLNILQVNGRSDLILKLEVIKKGLLAFILLFTMNISIQAMLVGLIIHSYICFIFNAYFTQKVTTITVGKQISSLTSTWIGCMISAFIAYEISDFMQFSNIYKVLCMIIINIILYILIIRLIDKKLFNKILSMIN